MRGLIPELKLLLAKPEIDVNSSNKEYFEGKTPLMQAVVGKKIF